MTDSLADQALQADSSARGRPFAQVSVRAAYRTLSICVAMTLLSLMSLATADVIGRYIFDRPIDGASEVIELLLAGTVFSALPLLTLRQEDVTIDLLSNALWGWVEGVRKTLIGIVIAVCYAVLAYKMWLYADYMRTSSHEITPILGVPIYPVSYVMSVMLALSGACSIAGSLGVAVQISTATKVVDKDD